MCSSTFDPAIGGVIVAFVLLLTGAIIGNVFAWGLLGLGMQVIFTTAAFVNIDC
jgi:hypothetical protein